MIPTAPGNRNILTLNDVVQRLRQRLGMFDSPRDDAFLVRAVRDALRSLPQRYNWKYFQREFRFNSSASAGHTVTYTESNKQAVTTGVWPADAEHGELHISGVPYPVSSRVSDTVLLLGNSTPGVDFSGSATWARESYPIPDVVRVHTLWQQVEERPVNYLSPASLTERKLAYESPGTPVAFSFAFNSRTGDTDLVFSPPPSNSQPYIMSADIAPPRPLVHQQFISVSASSGATSFSAPNARASWVGAIVRVTEGGSSSAKQESLEQGDYTWQATIANVSGSTVTIDTALPEDWSSEDVLVSSLVDIESDVMLSYLESMCVVEYRKNGTQEDLRNAVAIAEDAFSKAIAADSKANRSRRVGVDLIAWPVTDTRYANVIRDV